jgi:hypothetical protein
MTTCVTGPPLSLGWLSPSERQFGPQALDLGFGGAPGGGFSVAKQRPQLARPLALRLASAGARRSPG